MVFTTGMQTMKLRIVSWKKVIFSIVFFPLIALYIIPIFYCFGGLFGDVYSCRKIFADFSWYGLPILLILIVFFLIPLMTLCLNFGFYKWKYIIIFSVIVSMIMSYITNPNNNYWGVLGGGLMYVVFIFPVGLLIWFFGIRKNVE